MYYTSSLGRIELKIKRSDAGTCCVGGRDAMPDVCALMQKPYILRQLFMLDKVTVFTELKEYGAWDDNELADHTENLRRLLWLACGDITEENRK